MKESTACYSFFSSNNLVLKLKFGCDGDASQEIKQSECQGGFASNFVSNELKYLVQTVGMFS